MTKKQFTYNVNKNCIECNGKFVAYVDSIDGFRIANKMNVLQKENEQLKAQLFCDDEEGICNICKHHYLVKDEEMELGYYNSRCKKGHYECAREFLKHCEDFEEVEE